MAWEVEYTKEFGEWWDGLTESEQDSIDLYVDLIQNRGPNLPYPHSSEIRGSRYGHMRELRVQHQGEPYRILYAFDPRRCALLLIGGNKTGNNRWYEEFVPIADRLYSEHLAALESEEREE